MNNANHSEQNQHAHQYSFILNRGYGLTNNNVHKAFRFSDSSSNGIVELVRGDSHGIFIYIVSAIGIVLKKYTQDTSILLSVPGSLHNESYTSVPVKFAISDTLTFRELLNATKDQVNTVYRAKEPLWSPDRTTASNILVEFDSIHDGSLMNNDDGFDLVFGISLSDGNLSVNLRYNERYFNELQMAAFMEHLEKTIRYYKVLDTAFFDIDIFTEKQRNSTISKGIASTLTLDYNSLQELFESQAVKHPSNIAVQYNDIQLTYKDLNALSNKLANHLRDTYKVKTNQLIGIMAERSENLIVAILGILKAGAAYVPIDPNLPRERQEFIISDAHIELLLIDSNQFFNIKNDQVALFALDMQLELLTESDEAPGVLSTQDDLAYVIYTSGTSGIPKGVMLKHGGAVNMTVHQGKILGIQSTDSVLQFASLSFDASVSEIFMALGAGATLIMAGDDSIKNTERFIDYMKTSGVTVITLPPAYLYSLDIDRLKFLRVLLTAGEAINIDVANKLKKMLHYYNGYGPTECSVCVSMFDYDASENYTESIPIGKLLPNTRVLVLDQDRELVPQGVEGELYVSGIGLAKGYLGNSDLANSGFISNLDSTGTVWYKTGDKVKWSGDLLLFCGRNDRQIKLRGFRIEPQEIEVVAKLHPAVQNAFAFCPLVSGEKSGLTLAVTVNPEQIEASDHEIFEIKSPMDINPDYVQFTLPNNLTIYHLNSSETKVIYREVFENKIYDTNGVQIKEGDIIFDVGANIGLFSLYAGLKYKNVKIYAFEPIKQIFEILEKNLSLYSLDARIFNAGISDETKTAMFQYYPGNTAISGMYSSDGYEIKVVKQYMKNKMGQEESPEAEKLMDDLVSGKMLNESVECQLFGLSDIIEQERIDRIDLLKVDVEKSEEDVLNGIRDIHWPIIRQIVIEVHDQQGRLEHFQQLLISKGFELNISQDEDLLDTDIYTIHASRNFESDTMHDADDHFDRIVDEIKKLCTEKLPHYMIPSMISIVNAIPLNNSGKVDKPALEKLLIGKETGTSGELPRNENEQMLFEIWTQVLTKKPISVFDDFFSLGGDSIKAIQIVSKLHSLGYKTDVNKVFEHTTIASLSKYIALEENQVDQSAVVGNIPLTPIQSELFRTSRKDPHHFNQSVLLFFEEQLSIQAIENTFSYIQKHHDILRATIGRDKDHWVIYNHDADFPLSIQTYDLSGDERYKSNITKIAGELQQSIDLENGPLMRLGVFNTDEGNYVLIVIHHMVIDTVSWRILLEDINTLFSQYTQGKEFILPLKTHSFKEWAEFLREYAQQPVFKNEKQFWIDLEKRNPCKLPRKKPDSNAISDAMEVDFSLDTSYTMALLTESNKAYNTEISDLLLAALSMAFGNAFNMKEVLISLEGHGREQLSDTINISRTVGWFTINYPVVISMAYSNELPKFLIEVKETLRKIPNKGIGYGIHKFLAEDSNHAGINSQFQPQIAFNYLGQFDSDINDLLFSVSSHDKGNDLSPDSDRFYDLSINGFIADGQLSVSIEYNNQQFERHEIQNLADAFKDWLIQIIDHCAHSKNQLTPSDITEEDLSMDDLDEISSLLNKF